MSKVKHYVNTQSLRMLYQSVINSGAQYGIIAWEEQLHFNYSQYRLFYTAP